MIVCHCKGTPSKLCNHNNRTGHHVIAGRRQANWGHITFKIANASEGAAGHAYTHNYFLKRG